MTRTKNPLREKYKRLTSSQAYVYGLYDPRDNSLQYIGKTNCVATRWSGHWSSRNQYQRPLNIWLCSLDDAKLRPELKVFEICNVNKWQERECHYIKKLNPPCNMAKGGNGNSSGGSRWNSDKDIEQALGNVIEELGRFPTHKELCERNLSVLPQIIKSMSSKSAEEWALHFKVPAPQPYTRDPLQVEKALKDYLKTKTWYPSLDEFSKDGMRWLYEAVPKIKTHAQWAIESNLPRGRRYGKNQTPVWSDEQIEEYLDKFLKGKTKWPTHKQFEEADLENLYNVIRQRGRAYWCKRFNFEEPEPPFVWTDELIEEKLKTFLTDAKVWPSNEDFRIANLHGMAQAMKRMGGMNYWAKKFDLPRKYGSGLRQSEVITLHNKNSSRTVWKEADLEKALRAYRNEKDCWPTLVTIRKERPDLAKGIQAHSGLKYWINRIAEDNSPANSN